MKQSTVSNTFEQHNMASLTKAHVWGVGERKKGARGREEKKKIIHRGKHHNLTLSIYLGRTDVAGWTDYQLGRFSLCPRALEAAHQGVCFHYWLREGETETDSGSVGIPPALSALKQPASATLLWHTENNEFPLIKAARFPPACSNHHR